MKTARSRVCLMAQQVVLAFMIVLVVVTTTTPTCHAFIAVVPQHSTTAGAIRHNTIKNNHYSSTSRLPLSKTMLQSAKTTQNNVIIVVSPPGGVGEVTAVKAASMGASVKWFVVSSKYAKSSSSSSSSAASSMQSASTTTLSQDALEAITKAGGKVQLAGADADALLTNERNALAAVATWCSSNVETENGENENGSATTTTTTTTTTRINGLVCCMDGTDNVVDDVENTKENFAQSWKDAIKLAAKEASKGVTGCKLAILSEADDDDDDFDDDDDDNGDKKGGLDRGLLSGLFGSKDANAVPKTLSSAIKATAKLRHGTLFGIPESSPSFSILLGGPQKNPILCEEYQMRNVRLDPSSSSTTTTGGARKQDTVSCRHVVGEAAALMITNNVPTAAASIPKDVSIASLRGMDKFDLWAQEFERVSAEMTQGGGAAFLLFSAAFSSVPSIDRLGSWIATKWAPAVMRTYDIAAIRTGARPVLANQIQPDLVEIVWQELVNFESVTVGRLLIRIANDGITATRGPGDASKGFGTISRKPFNGEAILIQRLADAASQAVEKGLANKPAAATVTQVAAAAVVPALKKPEPTIVSSLQSTQTIVATAAPVVEATSGPRQAGARRSSEKVRGKRIRRAPTDSNDSPGGDDDDAAEDESGAFE